MIDESQLIRRISELPDDDLLNIIYAGSSQYRFETIVYAKAEIGRRGIRVDETRTSPSISASSGDMVSAIRLKIHTLLKSRVIKFSIGFFSGFLLFVAVNFYSYSRMKAEPVLIDAYVSFGLPFKFYASSGFMGEVILWSNLVTNVVIALFVSTLLGWASAKLSDGPDAA